MLLSKEQKEQKATKEVSTGVGREMIAPKYINVYKEKKMPEWCTFSGIEKGQPSPTVRETEETENKHEESKKFFAAVANEGDISEGKETNSR